MGGLSNGRGNGSSDGWVDGSSDGRRRGDGLKSTFFFQGPQRHTSRAYRVSLAIHVDEVHEAAKSMRTLWSNDVMQVRANLIRQAKEEAGVKRSEVRTRLVIVRPFCEFDPGALPTPFMC